MIGADGEEIIDVREGTEPIELVVIDGVTVWRRDGSPSGDEACLAVFSSLHGDLPAADEIGCSPYRSERLEGIHTVAVTRDRWLWVCSTEELMAVSSSGFEVPCVDCGTVMAGGRRWHVWRLCGRPQSDSIRLRVERAESGG